MENNSWFYIQSNKSSHVISASRHIQAEGLAPIRSQVHVYVPLQTDDELWTWEGQFIRNKATGLVLDIRKGRLRLIEDTEICLYQEKPLEEASNQLWGLRDAAASSQGKLIYSISNADWTLMQDGDKLLLYPQESIEPSDTWHLIDQASFTTTATATTATATATATATTNEWNGPATPGLSSSSSFDADYPQGGLSPPAKRGSQGSVSLYSMDSFKDYHDRLYLEKDQHLSDKALSMAIAYHSWVSATKTLKSDDAEGGRVQLQNQAEQEALELLLSKQHQDHHKETVLHLINRYINLLIDQKVATA